MRSGVRPALNLTTAMCLLAAMIGRAQVDQTQAASGPPTLDFPQGPSRDLVVKVCKDCHPVSQITRRRESRSKWSAIIEQMIKEGAEVKDEDYDKVLSYLSVTLGKKVRINTASAEVVAETFDIEQEIAAAIVKHRTDKGPFKDWKEIAAVPGVDAKLIEELKDNLDFSTVPAL